MAQKKASAKKETGKKTTTLKPETISAGKTDQKPKAPTTATKKPFDVWDVIVYPSLSEKSIVNVERQNKLVFIVKKQANKQQVKKAIETAFGVKVQKVNIAITPAGVKKAYVRLAPENLALDVATKLGMM